MTVLVTGVTGFLGGAVLRRVVDDKLHGAVGAVRRAGVTLPSCVPIRTVGDLGLATDWRVALGGVDAVVHCAARVHVMRERASDPLGAFRQANVEGTLELARQAAHAGVRRFIFISSIKVNGEATRPGQPFTADSPSLPCDAYGISKMEAEQGLRALAGESGMEVVVIRPGLVYGPGVKGNFSAMLRWIDRGLPLPLKAIENRRSLVGLENLVDLVVRCLDHPGAANETFLVSDGEDLSTPELLHRAARALNRPMRLVPVPSSVLKIAGGLLGQSEAVRRLVESMQVDITATKTMLGWSPPFSVDDGLREVAADFLAKASRGSKTHVV